MGSTGNSTGLHTHVEIRENGVKLNPANYIGIPNTVGNYNSANYSTTGIAYESHCQDIGWQGERDSWNVSGTEGESRRIEAVKISSNGANLKYRVHMQDIRLEQFRE